MCPMEQSGNIRLAEEFDDKPKCSIAHHVDQDKTMKNENGEEYNQIIPTLDKRARLVCERTCDIIGYCREVEITCGI